MGLINRPVRAGVVAVMGLAIAGYTSALATTGAMAAPSVAAPHLVALKDSVSPTTDRITGAYTSKRMSVEVALAPRDAAGLARDQGDVHAAQRYLPQVAADRAVRRQVRANLGN
jgi:hypothetical protein